MRHPLPDGRARLLVWPPDAGAAVAVGRGHRPAPASAAELLATAREDAGLAAFLLALPAAERREAVLREPRFRRQTLAELFALRAENDLYDAAADPLAAAELAAAVASALPGDPAGRARKTQALGYWLLGKALLRRQDWRPAEHAFTCIFAVVAGRESCEEQGLAATGLAQLRADLGQPHQAAALFLQAAYRFGQRGAAEPATACQAQLGLLLLETGDLVDARFFLRLASRCLDRALAPSLAARALLALSQIEAALGNSAAARQRLRQARNLYDLGPSRVEAIARAWWEARIAAAAGQHDEAEPLFDHVRRELLARGSLAEAARSTLDHLLLRIETGRSGAVEELAAALAQAFPEAARSWAEEMTRLARLAAGEPAALYAAIHELRTRSRRAAPPSPGRPDLLTPSRTLADRLLRRRGEHEDPLGAAAL
jgi:hypothetical protein